MKKVWFNKVAQAFRLPNVPQAARLPSRAGTCFVSQAHSQPLEDPDRQVGRSLYDPDTTSRSEKECHKVKERIPTSWQGVQMPAALRAALYNLDLAVGRLYRKTPFASDEERLEHLFKLYEEMVAKESLV